MIDNLHSCPNRNPAVIDEAVGEERVLVFPERGKVAVLNPVAARIWSLCSGRISVLELIEIIVSEYEIDFEQGKTDVLEFLAELTSRDAVFFQTLSES
jgi:hypothetical protein